MYRRLLARQVKRYIKDELIPEDWQALLDAVNQTYEHYEKDLQLIQRSLEICSHEMQDLIRNLKEDIVKRVELEKNINIRISITHMLLEMGSSLLIPEDTMKTVESYFDADVFFFWLNDSKTSKSTLLYASNPKHNSAFDKCVNLFKQKYSCVELFNHCDDSVYKPYFTQELEKEEEPRYQEAKQHGLNRLRRVPIVFGGQFYGLYEGYFEKFSTESADTYNLVQDISTEVGLFLDHQASLTRERELQKQLINSAHLTGMMEIASSTLHNVGNILNSINISLNTLYDNHLQSQLNNLPKLSNMIKEHANDLTSFISKDSRGKLIPDYITILSDWWKNDHEKTMQELLKLRQNVEHITNIINSQQRMGSIVEYKEKINLDEFLDDLITLHTREIENNLIHIEKDYGKLPPLELNHNRLLQILENLIRNSIEALKNTKSEPKVIRLKTRDNGEVASISVIDNGCGIDPNILVHLFSYGFSTKKDGHGFGLHSSSIIAQEMGGNLSVKNLGLGVGAEFILTLPYPKISSHSTS